MKTNKTIEITIDSKALDEALARADALVTRMETAAARMERAAAPVVIRGRVPVVPELSPEVLDALRNLDWSEIERGD